MGVEYVKQLHFTGKHWTVPVPSCKYVDVGTTASTIAVPEYGLLEVENIVIQNSNTVSVKVSIYDGSTLVYEDTVNASSDKTITVPIPIKNALVMSASATVKAYIYYKDYILP